MYCVLNTESPLSEVPLYSTHTYMYMEHIATKTCIYTIHTLGTAYHKCPSSFLPVNTKHWNLLSGGISNNYHKMTRKLLKE